MPALCPFPRSTRSALFVATSVLMSQAGAEESTLPEVVVSTTAEQSYAPPYATGATRTETPSREVPQSVRVLSRSLIDDVAATRMDGMLDYASGVSRQNNLGGLWDNYAIRGFTGSENTGAGYLVNGFAANRGYTAPRDTATIDRIEVLKGPSSSLYGSSEPGGVVNVVTRQPQFKPGQTYDLEAGNRDHYRAAADITGALTDNVAGRLIAVADHDGSTRDFVNSQRYLLAPSVTWALGASTLVQYSAELQRYTVPLDRGVVAINGRLGAVPRSRFLGEPNDGDIR
ncbi:TonB-dependent receptor plug domain-containing protein, partial [Cupriavidus sp.]